MTPDRYFDLSGKVALVTGGSRGLGRQMVLAFAERGADVIVASRRLESCEKVAAEVRELGRRAFPFAVHAAKWDGIDRLIAATYAEFGRVDVLVNNAGMSPPMPSHEVTEELFDSVVGLNFKGPFRLASQVAKRMYDGAGGVIINVLTDISKAWSQEQREYADNALGRPGNPEEIVTAALFLFSPASSFTSGAIVRVDGGLHVGQ
jgi:NAD(P)-dependent dehydrogenase (short-subunit alcohol dehydrogenase family)